MTTFKYSKMSELSEFHQCQMVNRTQKKELKQKNEMVLKSFFFKQSGDRSLFTDKDRHSTSNTITE